MMIDGSIHHFIIIVVLRQPINGYLSGIGFGFPPDTEGSALISAHRVYKPVILDRE
ncbi:MAG: hypothetical protein WAU00_12380 [Caldilinea sp.]|uniref:hypothetical protein n=1 Tax=Caldilinea sp. TaxID=2293560 RepID=UPI002C6A6812|nr:hypothetical protein [Anaerolineales bacterium]HQY90349.1 hypothetical protein [Caldilinea sp.]HRA67712.1 hypothetical protein [Caldilinea sp.]